MTDSITNLSEIDWDHIDMHPCSGMEGYESRPEYSGTVQKRGRYKAVIGLRIFRVAVKLFAVLGACLLMKVIIDYAQSIRAGTIEPPAYNELAFLVYLLQGLVALIGVLTLIRRFRHTIYRRGHPIHTAPCVGIVSSFHRTLSSRYMARTPYPPYLVTSYAMCTHPMIGLVECAECHMAQYPLPIAVREPYLIHRHSPLSCAAHSSSI